MELVPGSELPCRGVGITVGEGYRDQTSMRSMNMCGRRPTDIRSGRRYDEGCAVAMQSIQLARHAHTLAAFAVNANCAGRTTEARQTVAELLKLHPGFRNSQVREAFPVRGPEERDKMAAALRAAGLPD